MPECGSFLYRLGAATIAAAEIFIQIPRPAAASECVPIQSIPMGRTIQISGREIELPHGIRVRAVLGEYYPQEDNPEPCIENPVYMLKRGHGITPYILVRIADGVIVYEQTEGEDEPFLYLKEFLNYPEQ